jgi:hypothetical protein
MASIGYSGQYAGPVCPELAYQYWREDQLLRLFARDEKRIEYLAGMHGYRYFGREQLCL